MDFFKSAFSGGREEEVAAGTQGDCPRSAGAWGGGFGGLVKTLASRSESAIQTCRRDLGEFGTGLLKETEALRAAIRDLPSSLGAGAAVAPEYPASADRAADGFAGRSGGQAGDARASLVGRVLASRDEEEEVLSWDVEEDDDHHHEEATEEEQKGRRKHRADNSGDGQGQGEDEEEAIAGGKPVESCSQKLGNVGTTKVASSPTPEDHHASSETEWEKNEDVTGEEQVVPTKLGGDGILLPGNAAEGAAVMGRDIGDVAATSSRPSVPEEDDLGCWDEIEDLGDDDDDETEVGASGGTRDARKIDLRRRLSAAEEDDDEDLRWDLEDEEPIDP